MGAHFLDELLNPASVAIIGASNNPAKWGNWLITAIMEAGYQGKVFPINPKDEEVNGLKAYKSILDVPEPVDMVSVCIAAKFVPEVLKQAIEKKVKCAVILTNGFREIGRMDLEAELRQAIEGSDLRVIGPNIQGIINTSCRLHNVVNMSYPKRGRVGVLAQSGSVGAYTTERMDAEGVGISALINLGNQVDLCECDFIEYLSERDDTDVLALYLEGPRDQKRFKDTLIEAASRKPIVLMKPGATDAGKTVAASHTGSIAGNDTIFSYACRQFGVIRCNTMTEYIDTVKGFAVGRMPEGNRVLILSTSGGVGSVAVDELIQRGFELAELPSEAIERIKQRTRMQQGIGSVMDFGVAHEDLRRILEIVNENYEAYLDSYFFMVADQMPDVEHIIEDLSRKTDKSIIVSYMSDSIHRDNANQRLKNKIPMYETPDRAAEVLKNVLWYSKKRPPAS